MARVPLPGGNLVERRPAPGAGIQAADMAAGGRAVAEAAQRLGGALYGAAHDQDKIDEQLDEAGAMQIDVAYSDWSRDRLFTSDNAYYNTRGFNAGDQRPGVEKDMTDQRETLLGRATTPRMKYLAGLALDRRIGADREGVARHSSGQVQVERSRQRAARVANAGTDAVTYANDPVRFDQEIAVGLVEIRKEGAEGGMAPELTQQVEREFVSGVHTRVVRGMIGRGEIENAQAWTERNRDKLSPDAEGDIDAALYHPLLERRADGIVDGLLGLSPPSTAGQTAAANQTGEVLPRMVGITAQAESGNRERRADGSLVTSTAGAQGKMQVMPGTNLDPGFGVKPAKDNSDAERTRVGKDYLAAMMKRYSNDPAKAWAAYNWGPGNVDAAIAKYGPNWLQHAPEETQGYVRGNMAALGGRGPVVQNEARDDYDLPALLARVDQLNLPFDLEQQVRQGLINRIGTNEQLKRRDQSKAGEEAWDIVEKRKSTKESDIPQEVWRRMDPATARSVRAQIAQNNAPKPPKTEYGTYTYLSDTYASDPQTFAAINPSTYVTKLAPEDYERVLGWRRDVLANQANAGRGPQQVTFDRVRGVSRRAIDARIPAIQSTQKGKPADPSLVADRERRIYTFETELMKEVEIWQRANPGKQVTDAEIGQMSDRLLLRWHPPGEKEGDAPHFVFDRQPGGAMGGSIEVPKADMQRLRVQGRRMLGREPTDQEVLEAYRREARGGL